MRIVSPVLSKVALALPAALLLTAAVPALASEADMQTGTRATAEADNQPIAYLETREAYLGRLREVCKVDCLEPRPFQRTARRRESSDETDMAVIMDVKYVRLNGDRFELFNLSLEDNALVTVELLGSAGINTSQSSGVGGLPRSTSGALSPDVVVVSLDRQAFADFLNPLAPDEYDEASQRLPGKDVERVKDDILVEGDDNRGKKARKPTLTELKALFRNRRIVVRGSPELTPVWKGGRLDYKNKQVTLMVKNADDLVMLPRFDDDGEPVLDGALEGLQASYRASD